MSLRIIRPGLLSTVQDRGRHGLQHLGVVPCGPMDPVALELAVTGWDRLHRGSGDRQVGRRSQDRVALRHDRPDRRHIHAEGT